MTYISALPTPPSRADDTTTFSAKADALLGALPDFVTEANTLRDEVNAMRDDAEAKRAATATLKDDTIVIKDAAEDARDAALSYRDTTNTYRGQAETARDQAQTAAAAAGASAGLPSLSGNAGKQLVVSSGEGGVEWGQSIRRLPIFSPEAALLNPVSCGEILGVRGNVTSTTFGSSPQSLIATSTMFLAVGSTNYTTVFTSPDGVVWTARMAWSGNTGTLGIAASPDGVVVAFAPATTGTRVSTDHGVTWADGGALPVAASVNPMVYANGVFVVRTNTGYARSTNNGTSWTAGTMPSGMTTFWSIGGTLIAANDTATYFTSSDDVTWTERTKPQSGSFWDRGSMLCSSNSGFPTHYTTDGINWVETPDNNLYFPVRINGVWMNLYSYSSNGIPFTIHNGIKTYRPISGDYVPNKVAQKGNVLVALKAAGYLTLNAATEMAYFEG